MEYNDRKGVQTMYDEDYFKRRVTQLRIAKGVSARDMSLSLGQSESYMNKIENGKAFPSMQIFFYICDYFSISPRDFFDDGNDNPKAIQEIVDGLKTLDEKQIANIGDIVKGLKR